MTAPISDSFEARSFSPRQVIAQAAQSTGADFDFLVRTAARESNFDPSAKARTSSAAGLFQFIEQTWLAMVDRHGAKHGLGAEAELIERGADGRFTIADPAERQRVLDLRFDPEAASVMAGELASDNASVLRREIGREPSTGELYAAHFLGARGAAELITLASHQPGARADQAFPQAAAANRPVFFESGRPLSASALLAKLSGEAGAIQAPESRTFAAVTSEAPPAAPISPLGLGSFTAFQRGGGVLSPALVELLASLDAPAAADRKDRG
jgi:hypothetical protein